MNYDVLENHGFVPANHESAQEFFPVEIGDVYGEAGALVPGVQRVYRTDTDETLGVHTGKYKLIPYREGFNAFEEALARSGIDTTDMHVNTDYTHNGGRVFRQYVFPAIVQDDLALRLVTFNSYDGTSAFRGMSGFYRFVCANQSVVGTDLARLSLRHTKNADIDKLADRVVAAAQQFADYMPRFAAMKRTGLAPVVGYELIRAMPGISEAQSDHLFARWQIDQEDDTAWSLYNAMTSWSTHKSESPMVRATREERIAKLIEAPVWEERMAA